MASKFTLVLTPVDNFGGRSTARFGVGEKIDLTVKEQPPAKPPTPVEWRVKSGPATLGNIKGKPGVAAMRCGNKPGAVVLELVNTKDKSVLATKRIEVVAPSGAMFRAKKLNVYCGTGFLGEILLQPDDVSFRWVEMREGAAPYEGTGCFKQVEVTRKELDKGRTKDDRSDATADDNPAVIHPVLGEWVSCFGGKSKNKIAGADEVTTAQYPYGSGGTFTWKIPWFYRVPGANGEFKFLTAVHHAAIDKNGNIQVTKLNGKAVAKIQP